MPVIYIIAVKAVCLSRIQLLRSGRKQGEVRNLDDGVQVIPWETRYFRDRSINQIRLRQRANNCRYQNSGYISVNRHL